MSYNSFSSDGSSFIDKKILLKFALWECFKNSENELEISDGLWGYKYQLYIEIIFETGKTWINDSCLAHGNFGSLHATIFLRNYLFGKEST
jgi:hypothetical protein